MKDRQSCAKELVEYHAAVDHGLREARLYSSKGVEGGEEPIKLLEINEHTVATGVWPVYFGATEDCPFPVVVIEITPQEGFRLADGTLHLPLGWDRFIELKKVG